jgi:demethylmenaquinone methyltransferase/2-methoxy-6-polyprenyl-1,4-benzoquinol methylase
MEVFDSVADKYDLMNDLMSLGVHRFWKRFVARLTGLRPGDSALDVAGGTGDIALLMSDRVTDKGRVVVFDINEEMLRVGRRKCMDKGYLKGLDFVEGNAEAIPFSDNTFHCSTVGFGIRNVTHLEAAFSEMARVTKPGGKVICLEFSHPTNRLFSKIYDTYSFSLLPKIGELVTGNRDAYTYLPESIRKFPPQEELKKIMEDSGLFRVRYHNLFNGIAAVHVGHKV